MTTTSTHRSPLSKSRRHWISMPQKQTVPVYINRIQLVLKTSKLYRRKQARVRHKGIRLFLLTNVTDFIMQQTRFRFRFAFWYISEAPVACNTWKNWRPPLNSFKKRFILFPGTGCRDVVGANLVRHIHTTNSNLLHARPHDTCACDNWFTHRWREYGGVHWSGSTGSGPPRYLVPLSHLFLNALSPSLARVDHHNNGAVMFLKRDDSSAYVVVYYLSHYDNSVGAYTRHTCGGDGWVGTAVLAL